MITGKEREFAWRACALLATILIGRDMGVATSVAWAAKVYEADPGVYEADEIADDINAVIAYVESEMAKKQEAGGGE